MKISQRVNAMKKALITLIPAFILLSSQLMAEHFNTLGNYRYQSGTSTLRSELVESKESAYQSGHKIMSSITQQSPYELHRTLLISPSRLDVRSVRIDDSFVTVQEISRLPGKIDYQALVVVSYHYRVRESDN